MKKLALLVAATFLLGACSSTGSTASPLIPAKSLQLTAGTSVSLSTLAAAAVIGAAILLQILSTKLVEPAVQRALRENYGDALPNGKEDDK